MLSYLELFSAEEDVLQPMPRTCCSGLKSSGWGDRVCAVSPQGAMGVAPGVGVGFGFLCLLVCSVITEPTVNTGGRGERGQPDTIPSHHGAP